MEEHTHKLNKPFLKRVTAGKCTGLVIYGLMCECGKMRASDLIGEVEARERAKYYKDLTNSNHKEYNENVIKKGQKNETTNIKPKRDWNFQAIKNRREATS